MLLKQITVCCFRNIKKITLQPGRHFNLLYGMNGQGKTNLLESIYMLGNSKSFRHVRLPDLIRHGETAASIQGNIVTSSSENRIRLVLENSGRKVEMDGKAVHKASELHGKFNTVTFTPDDTGMVKLGPDIRRRYLDRAVYEGDIGYLYCWHDYHRILKQRNTLLKQSDKTGLDIWTEKLADAGAEVIFRRHHYVSQLNGLLEKHYSTISGEREKAGLSYMPESVSSRSIPDIRAELMNLLIRHQRNDEKLGTTTAGPHRDDLIFLLDGRPLKSLGSQGQQKSFVLALKMAEIDHLQAIYNESPVLLLDDISSELDMNRKVNLLDFLNRRKIQTFITSTESSAALVGATKQCSVFHVEHGNLTYKGSESNE